jgi:anti-sigma-K factor RskA
LAFAQQNEKMAESAVKALKDEEAKLRARLEKVEAGIKRWENLLGALKQSQGDAEVPPPLRTLERVDRRASPASSRPTDPPAPDNDRSFKRKAEARDRTRELSVDPGT